MALSYPEYNIELLGSGGAFVVLVGSVVAGGLGDVCGAGGPMQQF